MGEAVEVKIRPVGNALGVILPGRLVKEEDLKRGERIFVSVFKKGKLNARAILGLAKGAKPFVREHGTGN